MNFSVIDTIIHESYTFTIGLETPILQIVIQWLPEKFLKIKLHLLPYFLQAITFSKEKKKFFNKNILK